MAGIYIHIPFCKRRCIYCDFFSTTSSEKKNEYIKVLCKEIAGRKDYLGGEAIDTIYLGGGTPSQLEKDDFTNIFRTIYDNYSVNPNAEITIEANPDDLTDEYVEMLSTLPFNRLSMGISSEKTPQRTAGHRGFRQMQECRIPQYKHRPYVRTSRRKYGYVEQRS